MQTFVLLLMVVSTCTPSVLRTCSYRLPWSNHPCSRRNKETWVTHAVPDPLLPLGLDFLTFLAATVLVIPVFKSVKASPVLGFLFSGLVLGQLG